MPQLDPDFASPVQWAEMYRSFGIQVVPARMPDFDHPERPYKMPAIKEWGQFQEELVPESLFYRWYGHGGGFERDRNMGVICGRASDNLLCIDLDTQTHPEAALWWQGQLVINNYGEELETWRQRTGGGGRQIFLRLPTGVIAPTNKTPIGVDFRGQGGFAMLPPSLHLSRSEYGWEPGASPWECGAPALAPDWVIDAVYELVATHGGHSPASGLDGRQATPTPPTDFDGFWKRVDGRESDMARRVWAGVMALRRQFPNARPGGEEEKAAFVDALKSYLGATRTRLPGIDNVEGLEREGRGPKAFFAKWQRAMRKWGTERFEAEAAKPPPRSDSRAVQTGPVAEFIQQNNDPGNVFEFLDVAQIKAMRDPEWLIKGLAVENALGFIFGAPGGGKTFVALSQALSLAVGVGDWFGRTVQRQGPVVYISSEGQADLKFRIAAWEQQNQVLADPAPFYLIRQTINFMAADDVGRLIATIEKIKDRVGVPVAVYVDTVSRVLPGADENLQKDMTLFIAACDAIRQRYGATVVGVHHTSRAGNGHMRGSTVFDGAGDFLLQVEKGEGGEPGQLTAHKIKAARDGWKQPFRLEEIALPFGQTSLAAVPAEAAPEQPKEGWPDRVVCRQILCAMQEAWQRGGKDPWSTVAQSGPRYAPKIMFVRWHIKEKMAKEMIDTWQINKQIRMDPIPKEHGIQGLNVIGEIP